MLKALVVDDLWVLTKVPSWSQETRLFRLLTLQEPFLYELATVKT
jgi:hypothetical protein